MPQISKYEEIHLHRELAQVHLEKYALDFCKLYHEDWNKYLVNQLPCSTDSLVLEAGCGVGILLDALAKRFQQVIGLDISAEMLAAVNTRNGGRHLLITGDGEALPVRSSACDAVVWRGSLHHMPSVSGALEEVARVLKPGGYLLLCETCNDSLMLRALRQAYLAFYTRVSDNIEKNHPSFRSPELLCLIQRAGLAIRKVQRFGYLAYPLGSMPEYIPLMRYVPFNVALTRFLIRLDHLAARTPGVRSQAWAITILAQKPMD